MKTDYKEQVNNGDDEEEKQKRTDYDEEGNDSGQTMWNVRSTLTRVWVQREAMMYVRYQLSLKAQDNGTVGGANQ